jgi:hypothetical protein
MGSASVANGDLLLRAVNVSLQPGLFFHGANQTQIPFGSGWLCTTGDLARGSVTNPTEFIATYAFDGSDLRHDLAGYVGSTRYFQYWFREGSAFDTSDSIAIWILP